MTEPEGVRVLRHQGWAEVVLDRPERKNAIIGPMAVAFEAAFTALGADAGVGCIVLRGEGGVFSSGLDLKEFNAQPAPAWLVGFQPAWLRAHLALYRCPAPVVCALERYAINAGAALALGSDLVIAGESAYLQVGEVQQGVAAPMNAAWLSLRFGEPVAAQLALTGRRVGANDLLRLGIATEIVPDGAVRGRAEALAQEIAAFPPSGPRANKAVLRAARGLDAEAVFERAAAAARVAPRPLGPLATLKRE